MHVKKLSLIVIILLLCSGFVSAQDNTDKSTNYITDIQSTKYSEVLQLEITKGDEGKGVQYYNYKADKFVDSVSVYSDDYVSPESQTPDGIFKIEQHADIIREGGKSVFRLKTPDGGIWEEFEDNGFLNDTDINNLEVTGFRTDDYIGVVMSAYNTATGSSDVFLFSYYGQSLRSHYEFDYKVDLSSVVYYDRLAILEIPISDTEGKRYYSYNLYYLDFIDKTDDARAHLFDAMHKTITTVKSVDNDNTKSKLNVTKYVGDLNRYSRVFDSSEFEDIEITDQSTLSPKFLFPFLMSNIFILFVVKSKQS